MRRVEQVPNGCAIAVLQMITEQPFDEIATELNFRGVGFGELIVANYLRSKGYRLETRARWPVGPKVDWPAKPFAPMHYCIVDMNMHWCDQMLTDTQFRLLVKNLALAQGIPIPVQHIVAMDDKGAVYDPDPNNRAYTDLSLYKDVLQIIGVTPPGPPL